MAETDGVFRVELHADDGGDVTIEVAGEVDAGTADELGAALNQAVNGFAGEVAVNLAAVTFFDSSALRVLVGAHAALTRLARRLVVVDPAASTRRLFELTGLLAMFGLGCG